MSLAFTSTLSRALPQARRAVPLTSPIRRQSARWVAAAATPDSARAKIASEKVMVFSTSWCPYCARVKALFSSLDVPFTAWELDEMQEGGEIRRFLIEETGQSSVPNVFVGGNHVGGCDNTYELHAQGKLMDMVNSAKL